MTGARLLFMRSPSPERFCAQLPWENMQCPRFFIHPGGNAGQSAMVLATLGDVR